MDEVKGGGNKKLGNSCRGQVRVAKSRWRVQDSIDWIVQVLLLLMVFVEASGTRGYQ
jgi:hypothetical protein